MKGQNKIKRVYDKARLLYSTNKVKEALELLLTICEENTNREKTQILMGACYYSMNKVSLEAELAFKNALAINSKSLPALRNLALVLIAKGDFQEGKYYLESAISIEPNYLPAHLNLGILNRDLGNISIAIEHFKKTLTIVRNIEHRLQPEDKLGAITRLIVLLFLTGDFKGCDYYLPDALKIKAYRLEDKSMYAYLAVIAELIYGKSQYCMQFENVYLPKIYAIGESHTLSMHNQAVFLNKQEMQIKSIWIEGCKQWHLGNSKSLVYKNRFIHLIATLPRNSTIVMVVGEIDCRENEGIIAASKKINGSTIIEIAQSTIDGYLAFVHDSTKKFGHNVIIWGVPATNVKVEDLTSEDKSDYLLLLNCFNTYLRNESIRYGFGFADIFALTNVGNGIASGQYHSDIRHVTPEAVKETFDKYFTVNAQSAEPASLNFERSKFLIKESKMTQTVTIEDKDYDLDKLSDEAKNQLVSLQYVDGELQKLNAQAAVLQTARMAYAEALKEALPKDKKQGLVFN